MGSHRRPLGNSNFYAILAGSNLPCFVIIAVLTTLKLKASRLYPGKCLAILSNTADFAVAMNVAILLSRS